MSGPPRARRGDSITYMYDRAGEPRRRQSGNLRDKFQLQAKGDGDGLQVGDMDVPVLFDVVDGRLIGNSYSFGQVIPSQSYRLAGLPNLRGDAWWRRFAARAGSRGNLRLGGIQLGLGNGVSTMFEVWARATCSANQLDVVHQRIDHERRSR